MEATELKNGTEQKTEEKKYYGKDFAKVLSEVHENQSFSNDCVGIIEDELTEILLYMPAIYILKKKGIITRFKLLNTTKTDTAIIYKYNRQHNQYENIIERAERKIKRQAAHYVPMGELVEQQVFDDLQDIDTGNVFNSRTMERVDFEDSTTGELNQLINEELKEQMPKASPKKGKAA